MFKPKYDQQSDYAEEVRREIGPSMFERAMDNRDPVLAFSLLRFACTHNTPEAPKMVEDFDGFLNRLSATEGHAFQTRMVHTGSPEEKAIFSRNHERAIGFIGQFRNALEHKIFDRDITYKPLPGDESPVDLFPSSVIAAPLDTKQYDTVRLEICTHIFKRALEQKDVLAAYNQLDIAKNLDIQIYADLKAQFLKWAVDEMSAIQTSPPSDGSAYSIEQLKNIHDRVDADQYDSL